MFFLFKNFFHVIFMSIFVVKNVFRQIKPKMTKKIKFENFTFFSFFSKKKIEIFKIWFFFVIFGFFLKKNFLTIATMYESYQKKLWVHNSKRKKNWFFFQYLVFKDEIVGWLRNSATDMTFKISDIPPQI